MIDSEKDRDKERGDGQVQKYIVRVTDTGRDTDVISSY